MSRTYRSIEIYVSSCSCEDDKDWKIGSYRRRNHNSNCNHPYIERYGKRLQKYDSSYGKAKTNKLNRRAANKRFRAHNRMCFKTGQYEKLLYKREELDISWWKF
jgi:hypothetical protein